MKDVVLIELHPFKLQLEVVVKMVLESIGDFSAVISMVTLVVTWCILQPLKQSIASLTKSLDKLTETFEVTKAEVNELRERMAKVEASTTSAHKRLDDYLK